MDLTKHRESYYGYLVFTSFYNDGNSIHWLCLPWGQMSFWGATVITNLFSAIPLIGETLTTWLGRLCC